MKINDVYHMDCLDGMKDMDSNIIDLTITSPPYDDLRNYTGYSFNFEPMAKELYRITKFGGVIVWVVNDAVINGSETGTSFRQALFFKEVGFNLHDTMLYKKYNIPVPAHGRYNQVFEYMFVLSKGKPKTFNPIKDRKNKTEGNIETTKFRQKDGSIKKSDVVRKTEVYGIRTNIWEYMVGGKHSAEDKYAKLHPAIFPEKLVEDHIKSWSNKGDLVMDPFCGSGSTLIVAKYLDRNYIGFEISEEYVKISKQRIESRPTIGEWI